MFHRKTGCRLHDIAIKNYIRALYNSNANRHVLNQTALLSNSTFFINIYLFTLNQSNYENSTFGGFTTTYVVHLHKWNHAKNTVAVPDQNSLSAVISQLQAIAVGSSAASSFCNGFHLRDQWLFALLFQGFNQFPAACQRL